MKTIIPTVQTRQICILASKSRCIDQLIRKATEMKLHPKINQKGKVLVTTDPFPTGKEAGGILQECPPVAALCYFNTNTHMNKVYILHLTPHN
jgi:hypothetical protein